MKRYYVTIFLLLLLHLYQVPNAAGHEQQHNHISKHEDTYEDKFLTEGEVKGFINSFRKIEKELTAVNSSIFDETKDLEKYVRHSKKINDILKNEGISSDEYADIFNHIVASYNEIKMLKFEDRIKKDRHERFKHREKLMIDHEAEDHMILHELQRKNFSEKYPEEYLGGLKSEPEKNVELIKKYEKELDRLFMN